MSSDINYKEAKEYQYGKMPMAILHNHLFSTDDKFIFSVLYSWVNYQFVHDDPQHMHYNRLSFLTGIPVHTCHEVVHKLVTQNYIIFDEVNIEMKTFTCRFTTKAFDEYKHSKITTA